MQRWGHGYGDYVNSYGVQSAYAGLQGYPLGVEAYVMGAERYTAGGYSGKKKMKILRKFLSSAFKGSCATIRGFELPNI